MHGFELEARSGDIPVDYNRIADAREREINIKQPLRQEGRVPFCQACSQVQFSTSLEKLYNVTA
jgi:hypothetical protein